MYNIYVNDDQCGSGSPIFKHVDLDSEHVYLSPVFIDFIGSPVTMENGEP